MHRRRRGDRDGAGTHELNRLAAAARCGTAATAPFQVNRAAAAHYEREVENLERCAKTLWEMLLRFKDIGPAESALVLDKPPEGDGQPSR